eukprot:TRINITY_DN6596_c0_g1_i2.p1 TRINITY_DN6596_c0_g1~~TRINITY_DN6596_c0_g1_i2.p1  ORF type:complete len:546 (-),score=190.77 TRINITY_DN6596_c0_g1_i2:72-1709(-)
MLETTPLDDWSLALPDGTTLEPERTMWSYEISDREVVSVRRKPQLLVVFIGESTQRVLEVDFSSPARSLLPQLWDPFGLEPRPEQEFSLWRMSPNAMISLDKSLAAQSVPPTSAVLIKLRTPQNLFLELPEPVDDVRLYDDRSQVLRDNDGHVKAASLNQLVLLLTSTTSLDLEFQRCFFMMYTTFASPQTLLRKLLQRFDVPPELAADRFNVQVRVSSVLKFWLENHPQDCEHDLVRQITDFTDTVSEPALANQIRLGIFKRANQLKAGRARPELLHKNYPEPLAKMPKKSPVGTIPTVFDFDELETARQLTLIEFALFDKIELTEFLNLSWSKEKTKHTAANILRMIARANSVSQWVAALVVEPVRVRLRARRFEILIRVAEHLRTLNNFSTLMAFLGGFNNAAVRRLKFTRQLLPKKTAEALESLERLMSTDQSYKAYREALHSCTQPCLPYLGTYLSDLTFIDEGNQDVVSGGLINFGKRALTYRVISEIQQFQLVRYTLMPVPVIQKVVKKLPLQDERSFGSELYDKSMSREPRGAEKVP